MPFPALREVDADFAPERATAMAAVDYVPAGKVAFQASRRFWELDRQIYGGISWTSRDATQIWYPSGGLQQAKGILVGAYIWSDELGNAFAAKPLAQRLSDTLDDVAHLHPEAPRLARSGRLGGVEEHPAIRAAPGRNGAARRAPRSFPCC